MIKARPLLYFFCFGLFIFAGCSKQASFKEIDQINLSGTSKQQAMDHAEKVLSKMNFTIEKFDVQSGLIKCNPLRGAQWFEFWRNDNVGSFNKAEANLHSLRRLVTIQVTEQQNYLMVSCVAQTQKLDLTEKEDAKIRRGGSQIYDLFSDSGDRLQRLEMERMKKTWIDLGNDKQLQAAILTKIEKNVKAKKI